MSDDELRANTVAVDLAAGDDRVLAGERIEQLHLGPACKGVAEGGPEPDRVELQDIGFERRHPAPCDRALRIESGPQRHQDPAAHLLAAAAAAEPEGRY